MSKPITSALLLVLAVAGSGLAAAEEITVCSSGCDHTLIQDAVDAAGAGDTIQLGAETFYENVLLSRKTLTIRGAGPERTIVDGGFADRVFDAYSSWLKLAEMTIQNGLRSGDRRYSYGGGVLLDWGSLEIEHCVIRNNMVTQAQWSCWGGGIAALNSDLRVSNSTIRDNRALWGGGGGGILTVGYDPSHEVIIEETNIVDNHAPFGGGMFAGHADSLVIRNSTIAGNKAITRADGLYLLVGGSITIENSTVANNFELPHEYGGGVLLDCGTVADCRRAEDVAITNTTIVGNYPYGLLLEGFSGGDAPHVRLRNTIVANNLLQCGGIGAFSDGHNLISDRTCGFAEDSDLVNMPPRVLALADNGGPTWTIGLLPGSPAIDAGSRPCGRGDQRGAPRPFDGDGYSGPQCDIGAFEYGSPPPLVYVDP